MSPAPEPPPLPLERGLEPALLLERGLEPALLEPGRAPELPLEPGRAPELELLVPTRARRPAAATPPSGQP
ncbi:MAG: hypothetical protein JO133_00050 [Burkholderiaceae bacterium]|nr:hypothetical protein [Burkholderiaceae bacterium]